MSSRKLAIDILDKVFYEDCYSNVVLNQLLNESNLEVKDKALVTEIVYGTIKYKYTIDIILVSFLRDGLKKMDGFILNALRTAIYQIRYLDKIPSFAAVNEAVELVKKYKSIGASKLVNGVLRNYLRNQEKEYCISEDKIEQLAFQYSFEKWMVRLILSQYGETAALKILEGLNKTPEVTVRVNNIRTNFEEVFKKLEEYEYQIQEGVVSPEAIQISKGKGIEKNPLFQLGHITVQDESAMLVAPSMDIKKDQNILDLCSAPGGKTTHIAELLENTGLVKAFDIHENKLALIRENASRLGLSNIHCAVMDASNYDESLKESADAVLLDVPCSGLGIIRKKPEIKWTKSRNQLKDIVRIQRDIMKNAALYVKSNGILLYSTCTINKEENEENILWFLQKFTNFELEPVYYGNLDNILYHEKNMVTILPSVAMDGFFIAKLRRKW